MLNKTKYEYLLNNGYFSITNSEEKEAFELKRKAELKLNPTCCFDTLCTSNKSIINDACNLYQKSAEKYNLFIIIIFMLLKIFN